MLSRHDSCWNWTEPKVTNLTGACLAAQRLTSLWWPRKRGFKGCHEKPGWLRALLFIKSPSHRPDPNLGERKCGAAWGVTERQAQVSERQTAFSLSLPGDYGGDEMFSSVSNSSRRKFWAADERCGSIVEVPKRRKTKPTVSLSLPSRIFPAAILSFAREGKKYPDFDFSCFFFSPLAHMETQSLASAHQGPSLPVLCEVTYIMMWIFLALLLPTYW